MGQAAGRWAWCSLMRVSFCESPYGPFAAGRARRRARAWQQVVRRCVALPCDAVWQLAGVLLSPGAGEQDHRRYYYGGAAGHAVFAAVLLAPAARLLVPARLAGDGGSTRSCHSYVGAARHAAARDQPTVRLPAYPPAPTGCWRFYKNLPPQCAEVRRHEVWRLARAFGPQLARNTGGTAQARRPSRSDRGSGRCWTSTGRLAFACGWAWMAAERARWCSLVAGWRTRFSRSRSVVSSVAQTDR